MHAKKLWALAGLLGLVQLGDARAQQPGAEARRADAIREEEARLQLGDIDPARLTLPQKRDRSERMLTEQRGSLARGVDLLQQARAAKDIVQMNCVNEKLTQIKGLLRLSEQASVLMFDAMAKGTEDVVNHEFSKIAVAHQKSMLLRAEAEQCVGELSIYTGDTEVTVEIDETIPVTDPTQPIPPPPGPDVPPVASGF